jgi:outer membrane protein assembly factor BamA
MKNIVRLFASAGLALLMTTAVAAAPGEALKTIPQNGIIEKITFENTGALDQALVLGWIDTRPGDFLTRERVERIPARLKTLGTPRTFTYKAGSKPGQVILAIGAGC